MRQNMGSSTLAARESSNAIGQTLPLFDQSDIENSGCWPGYRLAKPSRLCLIHNNVDLIAGKLWNILYWLSREGLGNGQRTFSTTLGTLAKLLYGPAKRSHDYKYSVLHEGLQQLQESRVILVKQTEDGWIDQFTQSSYIAGFTLHRGEDGVQGKQWSASTVVQWEYYSKLEQYLTDSANLALLDPTVFPKLTSKHARSIYELCSVAAMEPEVTVYDIPVAVRLIVGEHDSCYLERRRDFKARCLIPGIEEVQRHSEFDVEPQFITGPRNSLQGIGFKVRLKSQLPEAMRESLERESGASVESMAEKYHSHVLFRRMVDEFHVGAGFAVRLINDYPLEFHAERYISAMDWVTHVMIPRCHKQGQTIHNLGAALYKAVTKGYVYCKPVEARAPEQNVRIGRGKAAHDQKVDRDALVTKFEAWFNTVNCDTLNTLWSEFTQSSAGKGCRKKPPSAHMLFYGYLSERHPEQIAAIKCVN